MSTRAKQLRQHAQTQSGTRARVSKPAAVLPRESRVSQPSKSQIRTSEFSYNLLLKRLFKKEEKIRSEMLLDSTMGKSVSVNKPLVQYEQKGDDELNARLTNDVGYFLGEENRKLFNQVFKFLQKNDFLSLFFLGKKPDDDDDIFGDNEEKEADKPLKKEVVEDFLGYSVYLLTDLIDFINKNDSIKQKYEIEFGTIEPVLDELYQKLETFEQKTNPRSFGHANESSDAADQGLIKRTFELAPDVDPNVVPLKDFMKQDKYAPIPNQYQKYDYKHISKIKRDQQKRDTHPPMWRPDANQKFTYYDQDGVKQEFVYPDDVETKDRSFEQKLTVSNHPNDTRSSMLLDQRSAYPALTKAFNHPWIENYDSTYIRLLEPNVSIDHLVNSADTIDLELGQLFPKNTYFKALPSFHKLAFDKNGTQNGTIFTVPISGVMYRFVIVHRLIRKLHELHHEYAVQDEEIMEKQKKWFESQQGMPPISEVQPKSARPNVIMESLRDYGM